MYVYFEGKFLDMYTPEVTDKLFKLIEDKEVSLFLEELKSYSEDPAVGPLIQEVLNEWQSLQVAQKNGLMDEEQVYFAIRAFFKRKSDEIPALLEDPGNEESGNLDSQLSS